MLTWAESVLLPVIVLHGWLVHSCFCFFRVHILNLSKKTHWQGHINRWVHHVLNAACPTRSVRPCIHWLYFIVFFRTYFWSRDKCLWRRETWSRSNKLSRSTQMPPPASSTTCSTSLNPPFAAIVCLKSSLGFDAATSDCVNFPRHVR